MCESVWVHARVHGCMDECIGVWMYGCCVYVVYVSAWVYAYMSVWMYGRAVSCVCVVCVCVCVWVNGGMGECICV